MTGDGFRQEVATCIPQKSVGLGVEVWAQLCLSGSLQENKWEWRSGRLVLGGSELPAPENSVKLLGRSPELPVWMDISALSTAGKVLTLSSPDTESTWSLKVLLTAKLKIVPGGAGGLGGREGEHPRAAH